MNLIKGFLKTIMFGLFAGAAGTLILNVVTYLDMLIRGRPASSVPAKLAGQIAEDAGMESIATHNQTREAESRRAGAGALMGYGTGVVLGLFYTLVRSRVQKLPAPVAGIGLGLTAMAASDVPAAATGVTDPGSWKRKEWAADIVPHIAYGVTTAAVADILVDELRKDRRRAA